MTRSTQTKAQLRSENEALRKTVIAQGAQQDYLEAALRRAEREKRQGTR